ncbi:MAG: hypothetical protein LUB83_02020, partial [Prevotellaceae bacterium]|nr:hypothetical protein [Prevotellaceae bacterium]
RIVSLPPTVPSAGFTRFSAPLNHALQHKTGRKPSIHSHLPQPPTQEYSIHLPHRYCTLEERTPLHRLNSTSPAKPQNESRKQQEEQEEAAKPSTYKATKQNQEAARRARSKSQTHHLQNKNNHRADARKTANIHS